MFLGSMVCEINPVLIPSLSSPNDASNFDEIYPGSNMYAKFERQSCFRFFRRRRC